MTPANQLLDMCYAYFRGRAVCAAVRIGLPEALAHRARAPAQLAADLDCHGDALYRLLRALASIGIVKEHGDGTFTLTELGEPLRRDAPGSVWASVILYVDLIGENWSYLTECVRTGDKANAIAKRADRKLGWATEPDIGAIFQAAMTQGGVDETALAATLHFRESELVADLGGGSGGLIAAVLEANPRCRGVLVDLESGVAAAHAELEARSLLERCTLVVQDLSDGVSISADTYLVKNVLHAFDDAEALAVLQHCGDAMDASARLLIIEACLPPRIDRADPLVEKAAMSDLNMLAVTGGRERGEHEWQALIERAGLRIQAVTPFADPAFPLSVIEVRPR